MIKKYKEYKLSKFKWFEHVPVNWHEGKISYFFEIGRGRVISELELNPDAPYPVYSSQTKNDGCLGFIDTYDFDDNILTWTTDGANAGTVFIRSGKFNCTNVCGTLKPKVDVDLKYYLYYLQTMTPFYKRPDTNGAKIMNNEMARIYCLIPPIEEQTKIAQYLDHQTAIIDQLIQQKEKLIELLKEKRQAVIDTAVTRGINSNISLRETKIRWLKLVPVHWQITAIKNILEIPITDGPHTTPDLFDEGIPFISAEAIKNGKIDFDKKRGYISQKDYELFSKKYLPKIKDIFMVKSGATTGNVAMVETNMKFTIWSPLAVFRSDEKKVLPEYLHYYLQSQSLRSAVEISWSYGTQQNIGMGVLSNISIPYPTIKEQEEILSFLDLSLKKIDQLESPIKEVIEKLKEYRQSIISEAVTGKIDVRDWRPNKQKIG